MPVPLTNLSPKSSKLKQINSLISEYLNFIDEPEIGITFQSEAGTLATTNSNSDDSSLFNWFSVFIETLLFTSKSCSKEDFDDMDYDGLSSLIDEAILNYIRELNRFQDMFVLLRNQTKNNQTMSKYSIETFLGLRIIFTQELNLSPFSEIDLMDNLLFLLSPTSFTIYNLNFLKIILQQPLTGSWKGMFLERYNYGYLVAFIEDSFKIRVFVLDHHSCQLLKPIALQLRILRVVLNQGRIFVLTEDQKVSVFNLSGQLLNLDLFNRLLIFDITSINRSLIAVTSNNRVTEFESNKFNEVFSLNYPLEPVIVKKEQKIFILENEMHAFNDSLKNSVAKTKTSGKIVDFDIYKSDFIILHENMIRFKNYEFNFPNAVALYTTAIQGCDGILLVDKDCNITFCVISSGKIIPETIE